MGKLDNILIITGHSLEDIAKMTDREFFSKITKLMVLGSITKLQHDWLNKQRLDKYTLMVLDIFGGELDNG